MHIGGAKIMCDAREARFRGLHPTYLGRRGEIGRPNRSRRTTGQEQCVLLVIFSAAQPSDAHQQQRGTKYGK